MRQSRTSGSVGAAGEQSPVATQPPFPPRDQPAPLSHRLTTGRHLSDTSIGLYGALILPRHDKDVLPVGKTEVSTGVETRAAGAASASINLL